MSKQIITRFALTAALSLVSIFTSGQSSDYINGLKDYQNQEFQSAEEFFQKEIAQNPSNDAAYYYLAIVSDYLYPESDKAEVAYKKAIELDPDNFWYRYYLAIHYAETGRSEITTVLMEELINDYPKNNSLYFELANLYLHQNELDKALKTLDKIERLTGKSEIVSMARLELTISANPKSAQQAYQVLEEDYKQIQTPEMATALGEYHAQMYEDSLALSYFNQALDMDDSFARAYYGRAHVYQAMRQYDAYFEDIEHFIKDKNTNPSFKSEYLQNLISNPQFVRAFMEEIDTLMFDAHNVHPKDSTLNTVAGVYFYQTDRAPFGIELLRQNTEYYPQSKNLMMEYVMLLYYNQSWDIMIPLADSILERDEKDVDIRQLRAIAFSMTDRIPEAINDYETIRRQVPKDSAIVIMVNASLGDLYYQSGNFKESVKCFERVLKLDPDNIGALNNYAYYLALEGKNLKKAKTMSQKTIEAEPDNPTYIDTYAWILHLLGQDLEAKAMFKHAMLYGAKESADCLDHYAEVLYALKEYDLAFIYWEQAKAMDSTLGIDEKMAQRKAAMK